ncbi:hypothetical protein pmac_cds_541 [Pandoravirus macleodensis]|uniref:Uncharacterized protein n=1 Tax=Pandoravirus macleodensis TaxID=2107707 RepID=A0A2U7UFH2_9VIRU|nr:hypothetical protein pmac_cds_541 [Pandoravirus macleodensis]AVK77229.1 hypothetical protein pmac_cds_541 [Pandoravirus macleodensis]
MEPTTASPKTLGKINAPIDLCHDQDDVVVSAAAGTTGERSPNRSPPPGGSGWIRRRPKTGRANVVDTLDDDKDVDTRSPQSRTPPPSGTVACRPGTTVAIDCCDTSGIDDDGDDDDGTGENDQDGAATAHYTESSVFGSFATRIIDHVEAAVLEVQSRPEADGAHACALSSAHRLARLDGMAERLMEAAVQHQRHKSGLPDRRFSKLVKRNARNTKANDIVRERFRIAQGLGKHYNELFHPRSNRFMGGPETAPATSGFRARMALFWLDTLARFDRTFNTRGDLPAPSIRKPLSARKMAPLCDDPLLATAVLADKFDPPDERARMRKRPAPRPTAPVDFTGPPARPRAPVPLGAPPSSSRSLPRDMTHNSSDGDRPNPSGLVTDDDEEDNLTDDQDDY